MLWVVGLMLFAFVLSCLIDGQNTAQREQEYWEALNRAEEHHLYPVSD